MQPTRDQLAEPLAAANARVAAYAGELRALYSYELLERNCVSEIFREIAAALAPAGTPDEILDCSGSAEQLGGCIDPSARLRFIPFVSAAAVTAEYPVAATRDVPSFRAAALAAMYEHENGLAVFLRESNVFTSTIYRRHADDSPFLFFTDDAVPDTAAVRRREPGHRPRRERGGFGPACPRAMPSCSCKDFVAPCSACPSSPSSICARARSRTCRVAAKTPRHDAAGATSESGEHGS